MLFWRVMAIWLGSSLMIGELIRSWGQDRPLVFVVDDFFIGIPLVVTGFLMAKDTKIRRAAFAASWGMTVGGLYSSFWGKLLTPDPVAAATNIPFQTLTIIIGLAYFTAIGGLIASLVLKTREPE